MALVDFLKTKRTPEELRTTLDVLREFKANEGVTEWIQTPFDAWAKLEEFEEMLAKLLGEPVEDGEDRDGK